jgi:hypothetical protein
MHLVNRVSLLLLFLLSSSLVVPTCSRATELRGNPAAHVLPGEFASEHWEITARFDSGYMLFVEFIVTNIGLGDHNAVVLGYVVCPDGKTHRFSNGRREGNWVLSPDRLRMRIGASLLDLHNPLYQLQVSKRNVKLDLRLPPDAQPLWAQAIAPPGYALDLLALAAPIEGILWLKEMTEPIRIRGVATVTHSWTNTAGSSLVLRRVEFFSLQKDTPVYELDLTAPNGTRQRWIVMKAPDGQSYTSEQFDLSLAGELPGHEDHGYTVPGDLQMKNKEIEGQVRLESQILQADPLADLPRPVRYVLSLALNLRPRHIWAQSQIDITWHASPGADPVQTHSAGITALTFVNPLSSPLAKTP